MKTCPPKQPVTERDLITFEDASEISDVFEILANCTRLRILHSLAKNNELNVSQLSELVEMKPQAVSNQLRRMSDKKVVEARREGIQIFYSISMKCFIVSIHS